MRIRPFPRLAALSPCVLATDGSQGFPAIATFFMHTMEKNFPQAVIAITG
jgi:hypothetical protein